MSTRRRTRVSAVSQGGENSDGDAISEAPPQTPANTRTSSSSRARRAKTTVAASDPVLPSSQVSSPPPSWSSRVTRSRSRSLMRDTETEDVTRRVTVSRVPRLDIQSEDEEELEADHNNITEDRDCPGSEQSLISSSTQAISWPTVPKEARSLLLASLLLLLLLLVINKVVETLHHDKNMNEAVILALAYALAPVRLTLEGVRLVVGSGAQVTNTQRPVQIDYDLLVDNILSSDKFHSVIDKVSSEKISLWGLEIEERSKKGENQMTTLNSRIEDTKVFIQKEIEDAISHIKSDNSNKIQYENSQREVLKVNLDTQISEFKQQIEELKNNIHKSGDERNKVASETLSKMREELKILEERQRLTSAEIQKCCSAKSDIDLVIENKVSGLVEQLKQDLQDKLVTEEELNLRLMQVETENKNSFVELTSEVVEETKAELEQLVNSKVEDLRRDLTSNLASDLETEANSTRDSGVDSVDVKRIVREALTKYDADKTGLFDFALETAGGSVMTTKCTEPYQMTSAVMSVWGIPFWWDTNTPRTILQPGTSPGQCWAFRGSHGVIVVQLSASIHITAVTIEHISSLLSPDGHISSAPATMSLAGVREDSLDSVTPLLNFTYSALGDPVQTFKLPLATEDRWRVVELSVLNNHGHPDYTCLYRFRVHGTVSQGETATEH